MGENSIRQSSHEKTRNRIDWLQQALLEQVFTSGDPVKILEAGCGSGSNISLPEHRHVTGIDISAEELNKNPLIDEKIVGDLQSYELPVAEFDLVVCWDVLEHLDDPRSAVQTLLKAVKPGGCVLLALPNVWSVKGLIAKLTPMWFHWIVYRMIYGKRYRDDGVAIFPTYLRWYISPLSLVRTAMENRFEILMFEVYESGVQRRFNEKFFIRGPVLWLVETLVRVLSLNQVTWRGSDCLLLFKKLG